MRFRSQELNGTDPQGGPPFGFDGVGMRNYFFRADLAPLRELSREFLTSVAQQFGGTSTWKPLTSGGKGLVMIAVVTYDRMYAAPRPDLGYTSQEECVFSIPMVRWNSLGVPVEVAFFAPYCFVTNDWSIITGRSVLGYPKVEGWFDLPGVVPGNVPPYPSPSPSKTPEVPISVRARAITEFKVGEAAEPEVLLEVPEQPLHEIADIPVDDEPEAWPFGPVDPLYGSGSTFFPVDERVADLLRTYAGVGAPQVALKQFRDVDTVTTACYQGLVDFHVLVGKFGGSGLLHTVYMHLHDYPSLNIAKRLGLSAKSVPGHDDVYEITPIFAYWYLGNFSLEDDDSLVQGGCGASKIMPAPGCSDLAEQALEVVGESAKAEFQQWRAAGRSALDGDYGVGDYGRDLNRSLDRTLRSGWELSDIYWQSLRYLASVGPWSDDSGDDR